MAPKNLFWAAVSGLPLTVPSLRIFLAFAGVTLRFATGLFQYQIWRLLFESDTGIAPKTALDAVSANYEGHQDGQ